MIEVLGRKTSGNVQKVLFLLEELGEPYERHDYGRQFGNTATPEYLALNPTGKVPTVRVDGLVIWESNTILRYLATRAGDRFYSPEPTIRTVVERWMDWLLAALNPSYLYLFKESKKPPGERPAEFGTHEQELGALLQIVDAALTDRAFITGDVMTLADIALAPILGRCLNYPIALPMLPALRAWHGRIGERPAYVAATGG